MNIKHPERRLEIIQRQQEDVITSKDLPALPIRLILTAIVVIPLLAVAAIYYGVINP